MPRKLGTNSWFILHGNAPEHLFVSGKDFLAKNHVITLELPLYSTDLTSSDFYQIPQLKSTLKGWRYCDANDIVKNATEDSKICSHNGFQECSHQLYSHWQKFMDNISGLF